MFGYACLPLLAINSDGTAEIRTRVFLEAIYFANYFVYGRRLSATCGVVLCKMTSRAVSAAFELTPVERGQKELPNGLRARASVFVCPTSGSSELFPSVHRVRSQTKSPPNDSFRFTLKVALLTMLSIIHQVCSILINQFFV